MYTIDDLESDIARINSGLAEIRKDRGLRYGSPEDTLANVRQAGGWRAAYVNAFECICRLRRMFFQPNPDPKDFANASGDLINYAFYIRILGGGEVFHELSPKALKSFKQFRKELEAKC